MEKQSHRKGRPKKGERRFDLTKAVELKLKGLSVQEISDYFGVRPFTCQYHFAKLKNLFSDPEVLKLYERNRGDFLKSLQLTVGNAVFDPSKLKKASINNLAYAFMQFYQAERLEQGKSTSNFFYADLIKARSQVEDEIQELEALDNGQGSDVALEAEGKEGEEDRLRISEGKGIEGAVH